MLATQLGLLGSGPLAFDRSANALRRIDLGDGAWIEQAIGWLQGDRELFEHLAQTTSWRGRRRMMYEREVDVPRKFASLPSDGAGHPILDDIGRALSRRYGRRLNEVLLALYRDGQDSVAWHGDRVGREQRTTVVAIVSVGGPRRFHLRPKGGGASRRFSAGGGDLLVMGGTCQRTWEHCVPKVKRAEPRIAIMFRESYGGDRG